MLKQKKMEKLKKTLILVGIMLFTLSASAQTSNTDTKVYEIVEDMPEFPGGNNGLMQYLGNNVKYPVVAQDNGIQGRVIVGFVVEPDGTLSNVHVLHSVDPSLDKEAMRVVKRMPKWKPGKLNGKAVRVQYLVPCVFRLQ